jgi:hypothetical protein
MVIHLSLKVPGKAANPRCTTECLWTVMLLLQRQWFIYSFIPVRVPRKEPSHEMRNNIVTVHVASRERKVYTQWCATWFPRGSLTSLLSLPQYQTDFSTIPTTSVLVDQSPVSQHVSKQHSTVCNFHTFYLFPRDPE